MKRKSLLNVILKYSAIFCIFFALIIFLFYKQGKGFVWINVSYDGLDQHLVNLHLLKSFITNFLTGNVSFFTWNIGYGMDMFANYNYYIFGDFLSYLAYFIPYEKLDILYYVLVILRVYLAGITFIIYCYYKKLSNESILIGTIAYLFSFYTFFAMARHPYFMNPVILFPILLLSTEKIILENKKVFFTIMVAILFIMSFYFGYMLSILIGIYGIILAFNHYEKKDAIKVLWKTFLCGVVGVSISMITLLPTIMAFFSSGRSGTSIYFYSFSYYQKLIGSLISTKNTGYWSIIGMSSIILVILPVFYQKRKDYKVWFQYLLTILVSLIIPFVATIIDCMSFPNNRWIFVFIFGLSFVLTSLLSKEIKIDLRKSLTIIILYFVIIILFNGFDLQKVVAFIYSVLFAYVIAKRRALKEKYYKYLLIVLLGNIFFNIYYTFDNAYDDYVKEFADFNANSLYLDNNHNINYFKEAVDYIKENDHDFYNIMVYPNILSNISIMNDYHSTSFFYSIVSNNYFLLAHDLENSSMSVNGEIKHFNYRTKINNLLNNRYLITTNKDYYPYGYELIKSYNDETFIFKNTYKTSFMHLYTNSISSETYEKLSPIDKEHSLLVNYIGNNDVSSFKNDVQKVDYVSDKPILNNQIELNDDKILHINFSNASGELYLYISNIKYQNNAFLGKKSFGINVKMNDLTFHETFEDKHLNAYYFDNKDLLVNLGYYEDFAGNIEISFSDNGIYTFDSLELLTNNFDNYDEILDNLYVDIKNVKEGKDTLEFDANILKDGVVSFATNYNDNFKIYVDDMQVDSIEVNKYFLGCMMNSGYHHIKLVYHNDLIFKGGCISLLGVILLIGIIIIDKKESRVKK